MTGSSSGSTSSGATCRDTSGRDGPQPDGHPGADRHGHVRDPGGAVGDRSGTREGEARPDEGEAGHPGRPKTEKERLSAIIQELNDRYDVGLTEEDRISLENLERRLVDDTALQAAAKSNTRGNVELTFEQKVNDYLQDMADSNFKLYERINDDREFGAHLLELLFEEFWRRNGVEEAEESE